MENASKEMLLKLTEVRYANLKTIEALHAIALLIDELQKNPSPQNELRCNVLKPFWRRLTDYMKEGKELAGQFEVIHDLFFE